MPRAAIVPLVDQHHLVAEPLDELQLVAREDDRHAVLARLPLQDVREHVDADGIEPGERLVEHEQFRFVDERGGQLHPLLIAE